MSQIKWGKNDISLYRTLQQRIQDFFLSNYSWRNIESYFHIVNPFECEVRQPEHDVHPPQRELGDGVALGLYREEVQPTDVGQGIDLLKWANVGGAEDQSLK